MYEKYNFSTDFQDAILACLIAEPEKFMAHVGILNSAYFTGVARVAAARAIFAYWRKHSRFPVWDILTQVVFDAIARTAEVNDAENIMLYVKKLRDFDVSDSDYVASRVIDFARERALYMVISEAAAKFQSGEVPANGFIPLFEEALRVGRTEAEIAGQLVEDCATAPEEPLPPVLIEGMLHQRHKLVLSSGSKAKKTWALIDLAVCVASGTAWWGRKCLQGPVLFANLELDRPFFKKRLKTILDAKSITLNVGQLNHWCLRGKVRPVEEMMPEIIRHAHRVKAVLVIIDPMYMLMLGTGKSKKDENSATDWANVLNELERLAVEANCAVAFAAHFSKGNQAAKQSIDRISGSGVSGRNPDSILTMTPHEEKDVLVVETTVRNFEPVDPFCVKWDFPLFKLAANSDPTDLQQPSTPGAKKRYPDTLWLNPLTVEGDDPMTYENWMRATMDESRKRNGTVMVESTWKERRRMLLNSGLVKAITGGYVRAAPNSDPVKG